MVKIFVGRIPGGVGKEKLLELFGKYGTVGECEIIKDYGFVHLDTEKAAEEAISALNNFEIEGGRLTVEKSHGKPAKKRDDYREGRGTAGPIRRDYDRRGSDSGRRPVRERSPLDRRGDGYYRNDRRSESDSFGGYGGGGSRYNGGPGGYGQRYPSADPGSIYGSRGDDGYGRGGPLPPSVRPYHDNGGQPSYGSNAYSQPNYSSPAPRMSGYNPAPVGGYDNYNRYSGNYSQQGGSGVKLTRAY
ncbi:hypothetical protein RvY_07727-2 [Ramazzottius varieornatus]|uniref:RRM domain-containing protein n=1 Tax=Ramazzottius varieornatus TaxID=947166 RepID=A0A1D1V398_RAMVA|nr:hypothetical protein RvY_07727-2 [Ramazzottius varieornatus]